MAKSFIDPNYPTQQARKIEGVARLLRMGCITGEEYYEFVDGIREEVGLEPLPENFKDSSRIYNLTLTWPPVSGVEEEQK